jgi:RNA polymerase sigma factor (sigma-70 family)
MDIPTELRELYPEIDKLMAPYMKARAARYRGLDLEDAIQEARMALVSAMTKYDFNKGDIVPYAREVIANAYRTAVSKNLAGVRCPRVPTRTPEGEWAMAPQPPVSYDALLELRGALEQSTEEGADAPVWNQQRAKLLRSFHASLLSKLEERERAVLRCKLDPPKDVIQAAGDSPVQNTHIGDHLGLDRNQMGWSLYKIRNAFTELAAEPRYADLFGEMVSSRDWPRAHVSKGTKPHIQFVARTLRLRRLEPAPTGEVTDEKCYAGRRRVEYHAWGAVVTVWRLGVVWTAVVEGRFNARAGEITGRWGARLLLPIDGYAQLARSLASEG